MSKTKRKKFENPLKHKRKNKKVIFEQKLPDDTPVRRIYKFLNADLCTWDDLSDFQWYLMYKYHHELFENLSEEDIKKLMKIFRGIGINE